MKDFTNRLVLITGGSSGIGLALAKNLTMRGAHVWIMARRTALLQQALDQILPLQITSSQRTGILIADVSNEMQVNQVLRDFTAQQGTPDLLINNAGITYPGTFEDIPTEAFHRVMQINYFGMVHTLKAVVPGMIARHSGYIVNVSSIAGFGGVYGYSAYGASKFAVSGLSETLLFELKYHGINVSVVFPPDTETPQLEEDRKLRPAVTEALSSDNSAVMSPENIAEHIIRGIQRKQYAITPGFESTYMYYARHTFSKAAFKIIGWMTDQAYNKIHSKNKSK